jgi:predicted nucleic acid-binding protein
MKYLMDTDVVVNHLRGKEKLSSQLISHGLAVSVITLAELYYGAYKSDDKQVALISVDKTLSRLAVTQMPISEEVISVYADLKVRLEKKGNRLDDFDLLIAATAIANNLTLVSNNLKHFGRIPELEVYS